MGSKDDIFRALAYSADPLVSISKTIKKMASKISYNYDCDLFTNWSSDDDDFEEGMTFTMTLYYPFLVLLDCSLPLACRSNLWLRPKDFRIYSRHSFMNGNKIGPEKVAQFNGGNKGSEMVSRCIKIAAICDVHEKGLDKH